MRFIFRSDATPEIGSGHVMRSSAIAEEAISRGIECIFVGDTNRIPWVKSRIKQIGFSQVFEHSYQFNSNKESDILIIDSYGISVNDDFIDKSNWLKVINIFDDLTPEYISDLRIHPGPSTDWQNSLKIKTVGGPKYVPLRKSLNTSKKKFESNPIEVLVIGGGIDVTNFVGSVAKVLSKNKNNFRVTLVMDRQKLGDIDQRFSIIPFGEGLDLISGYMDVVFATASTTSLEFIARGCAVAIGCAVDNQEQYYKELSSNNFALPIGKFKGEWGLDVKLIDRIVKHKTLRNNLRTRARTLIDLNGSERIVNSILNLISK